MVWQSTPASLFLFLLFPHGHSYTAIPSIRTDRQSAFSAAVDNKRINGDDRGALRGMNGDSGVNGDFFNQNEDNMADFNGAFKTSNFVNGDFFPRNEVNGYVVQESGYHRFLNKGRLRELRLNRRKSLEQMKNEENEDGYADMRKKPRSFWKKMLRLPLSVGERVLPKDRTEPGTLILVRHGESTWNANKTFTGTDIQLQISCKNVLRGFPLSQGLIFNNLPSFCRMGGSRLERTGSS